MTKNISEIFAQCHKDGRKALMPFLTAGYPDDKTFIKLMQTMSSSGADLIEVGIPFSDPLADGKTIQQSSQQALRNGVNIKRTFEYIDRLNGFATPVILMSYFNPVYHYGIVKFVKQASNLNIRGLIIPDLTPEDGKDFEMLCKAEGIDLIYLLAPTSNKTRKDLILRRSRGFVYLVSIKGVTGARKSFSRDTISWIKKVKSHSSLPVCVGFGISQPVQARRIAKVADGVIIGSAIIDKIAKSNSGDQAVKQTGNFIKQLRKGLDHE